MNIAITCLFTSIMNPLCPGCDNYPSDPEVLHAWVSSIDGNAVVLHDGWIARDEQAQLREWSPTGQVTTRGVTMTDENLFFQRWRHLHAWLTLNTRIENVWMTDGSDVRMLNPPWSHMRSKTLYVGSEEDTVSNKWIVDHHPSIKPLAKRSPHQSLMNAGLLGGRREVVLQFLEVFIKRFESSDEDQTDMAAFNLALYEDWNGFVLTGPPVHTRFNAWIKDHPVMWWAHK